MEEDQSQGLPIQSLIEAGVVGLAQGMYLGRLLTLARVRVVEASREAEAKQEKKKAKIFSS